MLNLVDVPRKPVFQYQEYQQIFHIFFWDIQFLLEKEKKTDVTSVAGCNMEFIPQI